MYSKAKVVLDLRVFDGLNNWYRVGPVDGTLQRLHYSTPMLSRNQPKVVIYIN